MERILELKKSARWAPLIVIAVVGLVLIPITRGPFRGDQYVIVNATSTNWTARLFAWNTDQAGETASFLAWFDTSPPVQRRYIRLVPSALLSLEVAVFGTHPQLLRLVSLAIHLLNCLLGFHLLNLWLKDPGKAAAIAIAVGIHGAAYHVVWWEATQAIVVAGLFVLLAGNFMVDLRLSKNTGRLTGPALVLCCFLAMTSYEAAIGLPLVLLILDRTLGRRTDAQGTRRLTAALLSLYPVYLVIMWLNWRGVYSSDAAYRASPIEALQNVANDFSGYVAKTLMFSFSVALNRDLPVLFLLLIVLPATAYLIAKFVRSPFAIAGLFVYLVFLGPPLLTRATVSVMNRPGLRQLYLPLIGLAIILAAAIPGRMTRGRWIVVAILCAFSGAISLAVFAMRATPDVYTQVRTLVQREMAAAGSAQTVLVIGKSACNYNFRFDAEGRPVWDLLPLSKSGDLPKLEVIDEIQFIARASSGFAIDMSVPESQSGRSPPDRLPPIVRDGRQRMPFGEAEGLSRDKDAIYAIRFTMNRPLEDYVIFLARGCEDVRRVHLSRGLHG